MRLELCYVNTEYLGPCTGLSVSVEGMAQIILPRVSRGEVDFVGIDPDHPNVPSERNRLEDTLFATVPDLGSAAGLDFGYEVRSSIRPGKYRSIPPEERGMLETKLQDVFRWAKAGHDLKAALDQLGLEIVYSDEDIATIPLIVQKGSTNADGTVAIQMPLPNTARMRSGTLEVIKLEYVDPLTQAYSNLKDLYGIDVRVVPF